MLSRTVRSTVLSGLSLSKRSPVHFKCSFVRNNIRLYYRTNYFSSMPPATTTTTEDAATVETATTTTTTTTMQEKQQQQRRTKEEIRKLVSKRVEERNSWSVNGVKDDGTPFPSGQMFEFFTKVFPKFWTFRPPPLDELDEHFPVLPIDWLKVNDDTINNNNIQITWLGHSSLLVQMGNCTIVTDPVFSERCSPSQWFGPKRFRPTPLSMKELIEKLETKIDIVLISHNHYDHLDINTVKEIYKYSPNTHFIVPLGIQEWFEKKVSCGNNINITEQDWYETFNFNTNIKITCIPMRHWTNRTGDRDQTLWCGYVVEAKTNNNNNSTKKFLFPGDTAWFDELKNIGKQYGPFDLAAIPIGAYEPREFMKYNHINVDEAVRMKDAIQATNAVPIHWGTFPLTIEPVLEPREKLVELMKTRDDAKSFVPWLIGETKRF